MLEEVDGREELYGMAERSLAAGSVLAQVDARSELVALLVSRAGRRMCGLKLIVRSVSRARVDVRALRDSCGLRMLLASAQYSDHDLDRARSCHLSALPPRTVADNQNLTDRLFLHRVEHLSTVHLDAPLAGVLSDPFLIRRPRTSSPDIRSPSMGDGLC